MNNTKDVEEIINLRREFHKCPEVGWTEMETTIKIIEYLKSFNLDVIYGKSIHSVKRGLPKDEYIKAHKENLIKNNRIKYSEEYKDIFAGYTGAIGILDTKRNGKNTILRFDIDGIGIRETNSRYHIPNKENFRSYNDNVMHACGHDSHIAIGLMVSKKLSEYRDKLSGKIYFIFQPAEEGVRGASSILNSKIGKEIFSKVDYFISSHIGFMAKDNEIVCLTEKFLGTSKLDVKFLGKASHAGSEPEKGKNALLGACNCTLNLHTLTQFSEGVSRINVGILNGGTSRNIIPSEASLKLEVRSDKEEILNELIEKSKNMIKGSAIMYDLTYNIEEVGFASCYKLGNEEFAKDIKRIIKNLGLKLTFREDFGASEDVTCMLKATEDNNGKAIYMIIGTNRTDAHHSEAFDINEENLINGLNVYFEIIKDINKIN